MNKHFDTLYWALKLGKLRGATLVFSNTEFNAGWKKVEIDEFIKNGFVTITPDEVKHYYDLANDDSIDDVHKFVASQILEAAGNKLEMKEYLNQLK